MAEERIVKKLLVVMAPTGAAADSPNSPGTTGNGQNSNKFSLSKMFICHSDSSLPIHTKLLTEPKVS